MLGIVAVLSLIPVPDVGVSDKLMHFVTYAGLSAGFSTLVQHNRQLVYVAVGLIVYGIALEFLQGLTSYRYMEVYDMLANSTGVMTGLMIRLSPAASWFRRFEAKLFRA